MVFLVWTLTNILDPNGGSWLNLLTISISFLRISVMEWWFARGNENISFCNDENPAENNDVDKKDVITRSRTNIIPHRRMSRILQGSRETKAQSWVGPSACVIHLVMRINIDLKPPNRTYIHFGWGFHPKMWTSANQRGVKVLCGTGSKPGVFHWCGSARS